MNDADLIELIHGHIAGEISPEQHAALQAELKANPQARAAFRERMDLEAGLRTWASEGQHEIQRTGRNVDVRARYVTIAIAASIAFVAFGWWFWPWNENQPQIAEEPNPPQVNRTLYVGTFGRQQDCVWDSDEAQPGSRLPLQTVTLVSGVAELKLDSGTNMILQGPCDLEVVGPDEAHLLAGNVVVHVTELSDGFTLTTPDATIIDEGTEYAVALNDEATEVHVFDGQVVWQPSADDSADEIERIASGEARRFSRSNPRHGARLALNDRMFVRQIEASIREGAGDALIAYDGFENLAGRIQRDRSGFGWEGGWSSGRRGHGGLGEIVETPGDIVFGIDRSERRQLRLSSGQAIVRDFEQPLPLDVGRAYYVSFLLNRSSAMEEAGPDDSGRYFELSLINDGERGGRRTRKWFTFGITSESLPFIKSVGSITSTASPITGDSTQFCVARILVTKNQVNTFLRIYGDGESIDVLEPGVWTTTGTTGPCDFKLAGFRLNVGPNAHFTIDELKIGTTWEAIVAASPANVK